MEMKSIVAIERDGLDVRTIAMEFQIVNPGINLKDAIKEAVAEFIQTEEGKALYECNCESFNWGDFYQSVPNEICEKHGFKKMNEIIAEEDVDWDEELV